MAKEGTPYGTIHLRETGDLVAVLTETPMILREKHCKAALREATTIFQKRAQGNVRALPHKWERWGLPEKVNIARAIRRKLLVRGTAVVGRTHVQGQARIYAAPVEYSHRMFIPGKSGQQGQVPRSQFWRPAKDSTQPEIERVIISILRRKLTEIVRT